MKDPEEETPEPPPGMGEDGFPDADAPAGAAAPEEDAPPAPPPPPEKPASGKTRRFVSKSRAAAAGSPPAGMPPAVPPAAPTAAEPLEVQNRFLLDEVARLKTALAASQERNRQTGRLMVFSNHTPESARAARAAKRGDPHNYKTLRDIKMAEREHAHRQTKARRSVGKLAESLVRLAEEGGA